MSSVQAGEPRSTVSQGAQPDVSVIMPCWNSQRFLRESIESVLAQQTDARIELLLVDDGSEDASLAVALEYAEAAPEVVRILRHTGGANRGRSASRNLALRHARGRYLTFLDADDVWLPGCVDAQLAVFRSYPEAAMVFGAAERWCNLDQPFHDATARTAWWGQNYIPPVPPEGASLGLLRLGELLDWYLPDESKVPCICSVMLCTDVAREVGGFEEQFHGLYDDQAFHAKVALGYPVVAHSVCLARYRQHPGSCCALGREDESLQQEERRRFLAWLKRYRAMGLRVRSAATRDEAGLRRV